ncbi:hypothetical protein P781_19395 [Vibrio mimicus CAIM 1883]|nr:hypothetical protein P780_19480 [Vibrio mimicus CAIM 1882]ERM52596.1 hypothetical protein P781_19395 [Vibrio mimicus CAIM 1883]
MIKRDIMIMLPNKIKEYGKMIKRVSAIEIG